MTTDDLQSQIEALSKKLGAIKKVYVPRAVSYVLNEQARRSQTLIVKEVRAETGIAAAALKTRFYTTKSTASKLRAKVYIYRRDIPAITLGIAQTRLRYKGGKIVGGGSIRVGRKSFTNAFINKVRSNQQWHVMHRTAGKQQYPIDVIRVHVVPVIDRKAKPIMYDTYNKEFKPRLIDELNYRISKNVSA